MSLLTARYALGVGPLREALSQLVAERLVTVVNQKAIAWHPCQRRNSSIFLTRAPIWKRCWYAAIERGDDAWEAEITARAHMLSKLEASDASEHMLDEWDQRHGRSIPPLSPGAAPTICYRCANAYLTRRPATALFGYVKPFCPSRCWKINISSITR